MKRLRVKLRCGMALTRDLRETSSAPSNRGIKRWCQRRLGTLAAFTADPAFR